MLKRFLQDDSGVSVVEYGIIASVIGVMVIFGLGSMQTSIRDYLIYLGGVVTTTR